MPTPAAPDCAPDMASPLLPMLCLLLEESTVRLQNGVVWSLLTSKWVRGRCHPGPSSGLCMTP